MNDMLDFASLDVALSDDGAHLTQARGPTLGTYFVTHEATGLTGGVLILGG